MNKKRVLGEPEPISRRAFIHRAIVAGAVLVLGETLLGERAYRWIGTRPSVAQAEVSGPRRQADACAESGCLSDENRRTLEALVEVIIPSDGLSPGARDAGVASLLERTLKSHHALLARYIEGLQAFDALARDRHSQGYAELPSEQQTNLFALVESAKKHIWPAQAPTSLYGKAEWKLSLWYYRKHVGITDAVMVFQDQIIRDAPEAFYATKLAWDSLGYSGPPFPFGYVGRRSQCSLPTA